MQDKISKFFDYFSIDLRNIPKENCQQIDMHLGEKGNLFSNYQYLLPVLELGMFNSLWFVEHPSGQRNIILKSPHSRVNIHALEGFVRDMSALFGPDRLGQAELVTEDFNVIKGNVWFLGRMWAVGEQWINIYQVGDHMELLIGGVKPTNGL